MLNNLKTAAIEWLRLHRAAIVVGVIIGLLAAAAWHSAMAQTISVSPKTGSGSVTPTITYTVPPGGSCVLSGGTLSGTKTASGTTTLVAVANTGGTAVTVSYKNDCVGASTTSSTGDATLTWVPPTQNTDGTALTNLASYKIYWGTASSALTNVVTLAAPASTKLLTGLPVGPFFVGITALTATGVESGKSNIASKTIVGTTTPGATTSNTATLTVTPVVLPNPPTGLVVTQTTAWTVEYDCKGWRDCARAVKEDRWRLDQVVGTVELGTSCKDDFQLAGGYYRVDRADVKFARRVRDAIIVAKCA